jgi:hypothetical protein
MAKSNTSPDQGSDKYDPVDCPKNDKDMCSALNVWAGELYLWMKDVEAAIWPSGPPSTSNPPPPPPFKP